MTTNTKAESVRVLAQPLEGAQSRLHVDLAATLQTVYTAPDTPNLFRCALSGPLSWQQRNGITVQEAVLTPGLAPQWLAALLAVGTRIVFTEREGLLADFLARTTRHDGQMMALHVPLHVPGRVCHSFHVGRTPADAPIVAVIAVLDVSDGTVERARLALTGVWRETARLADAATRLEGTTLNNAIIHDVAGAVADEVSPPADFRGSAPYRRELAMVLTRRALQSCLKESTHER